MRGMKKVSSDDSAFGSAESTMKEVYLSSLSQLHARYSACISLDSIYLFIV